MLSVPRATADRIAAEFTPARRSRSVPVQLKVSLDYLIAEGLSRGRQSHREPARRTPERYGKHPQRLSSFN